MTYLSIGPKYTKLYNKHFPIKTFAKPRDIPRKTWMTPGLFRSCKIKDKMYLKYKKAPMVASRTSYIQFRNTFKKIKNSRREKLL